MASFLSGCLAKRLITTVTVYFAEEIASSICNVAELVCFVTDVIRVDSDYVNVFVRVPHLKNCNCCVNWRFSKRLLLDEYRHSRLNLKCLRCDQHDSPYCLKLGFCLALCI
jgi:hypothetical protein